MHFAIIWEQMVRILLQIKDLILIFHFAIMGYWM